MHSTRALILMLFMGLVVTACGSKSPDDSKVLATVNGEDRKSVV